MEEPCDAVQRAEGQVAAPWSAQMQQMQQHVTIAQPASMQDPPQPSGASVLSVLLEHPAVHGDQAMLCRLLASSRQAAELAAHHCAGRLDARMCITSVQQFEAAAAWLGRHAGLLRSLVVRSFLGQGDTAADSAAAGTALACGLRQAEQLAPGSLSRLRSFSCRGQCLPEPPLLEALAPASGSLTRLELSAYTGEPSADALPGDAIAQLTALRQLKLRTGGYWHCDNPSALAGLPHLTRLVCEGGLFPPADLPRLPAALEHLELTIEQGSPEEAVDLGHLSRLTELKLRSNVREDAVLPPSLVKLTTFHLRSTAPLLRLTALRRLEVDAMPAELVELGQRLPALDDVSILVNPMVAEEGNQHALAKLQACAGAPVRDFGPLLLDPHPGAALQHISRLSGLTALYLQSSSGAVAAARLAAALGALPRLRELDVTSVRIDFGGGGAGAANAAGSSSEAELMRAVALLPELRSFSCWPDVSGDAVAELSAATGLTSLCVPFIEHAAAVAALAPVLSALTGLESLGLEGCSVDVGPVAEALCGLQRLRVLALPEGFDQPNFLRRLWVSLPELVDIQ